MKRKRPRRYRIPSSRIEHFRESLALVERHFPALADDHPCRAWMRAAQTMAEHRNFEIGDATKPSGTDMEFSDFVETVVMRAARLCRLGRSLFRLRHVGGAIEEELHQMQRDHDGFFHGEFLLHIATKLAYQHRATVNIIPRQGRLARKTPDIELPEVRSAIECVAHEKVHRWESATEDFHHASTKFSHWFRERTGWLGAIAVDLGFRGSPTLPDLGAIGPNHDQIKDNIRKNFELETTLQLDSDGRHPQTVHALILTWSSIEYEKPDSSSGFVFPTDISAIEYAPGWTRTIPILDKTFFEFPEEVARIAHRSRT